MSTQPTPPPFFFFFDTSVSEPLSRAHNLNCESTPRNLNSDDLDASLSRFHVSAIFMPVYPVLTCLLSVCQFTLFSRVCYLYASLPCFHASAIFMPVYPVLTCLLSVCQFTPFSRVCYLYASLPCFDVSAVCTPDYPVLT